MPVKKTAAEVAKSIRRKQAKGAAEKTLEELFNDFNRSRFQIYKFNFFRGIFFGLGSVLGGTVVLGLLLWLLGLFTDIPGGIGNFISDIINEAGQSR